MVNDTVHALVVHDDGGGPALCAAGEFFGVNGVTAEFVAKWDGTSWSALGSGVHDDVLALLSHDDGGGPALYVGGESWRGNEVGDSFLGKWGVLDTLPPELSCPPSVNAFDHPADGPGEVVNFTVTAADGCDPSPGVVCVPPSGSFFPRGTTLVSCTATDAAGNQDTCQFPVTVTLKVREHGFCSTCARSVGPPLPREAEASGPCSERADRCASAAWRSVSGSSRPGVHGRHGARACPPAPLALCDRRGPRASRSGPARVQF